MLADPVNPKSISFWTNKFIDLLFPTACAACGKLGAMICSQCQAKFQEIGHQGCLRCGHPHERIVVVCGSCIIEDFNLNQARACFKYSEPLETVIKRYKYDGLYALAGPLGGLMARMWPQWAQPPDIIVPIPLHGRRLRSRGFNQAQLLAHQLGPAVNIEVNDRVLKRRRSTKPQVGLSPNQRKKNVRRAFTAEPDAVKGLRILLIDDVFTTGSTMISAAGTLLEAGAKTVSAYCLARPV
jgi:ComF family protein